MSDALIEGELLVDLRETSSRVGTAVAAGEAATMVARRAKISDERQRELGNCLEWLRMVKMRLDRIAQKVAEGE